MQIRSKVVTFILLCLSFEGCVSQNQEKKLTSHELIKEISDLERDFLDQQCVSVLIHVQKLKKSDVSLDTLPPLAQSGGLICFIKIHPEKKDVIKDTISKLQDLKLHYPVLNESWFHANLADFYSAIGETANATFEKSQARDLLLAQKQDMITQTTVPSTASEQTVTQILATASALLNNDSPEQAIAVLDAIPVDKRTASVRKVRTDAVNSVVSKLRYQVHALFVKSTEQPSADKHKTLVQCEKILKEIIQNYPDYSDMSAVQYNLKQIQRELAK